MSLAAGPLAFLDLDAEESVAPRADAVAHGTGNTTLVQAGLEHHEGLRQARADDFPEAGHDLSVRGQFGRLEQQRPSSEFLCGFRLDRGRQEIKYPVVVDFVHGHQYHIFRGRVASDADCVYIRYLRKSAGPVKVSSGCRWDWLVSLEIGCLSTSLSVSRRGCDAHVMLGRRSARGIDVADSRL